MKNSWRIALLLGATGCSFHEVLEIELPEVRGMRSAIVAVETEEAQPSLRVSAVDLEASGASVLPALDAAGGTPFVVSARFYQETLDELDISARGPLRAGPGGGLPKRETSVNQRLRVVGDPGERWDDQGLGSRAENFESPDLPRARCREFEAVATHWVGEDDSTARLAINQAARLGRDAVFLQGSERLMIANEDGVTRLDDRIPDLVRLLPTPRRLVASYREEVVAHSCPASTPRLVAFGPDLEARALPSDGLPRCAVALSAREGELYALTSSVGIYRFDPPAARWRLHGEFSSSVSPETFIAFESGALAAIGLRLGDPDVRYAAYTVSPSEVRQHPLMDLPRGTQFTLASPAVGGGRIYFAFSENITGVILVGGHPATGFGTVYRGGSQLLTALASFDETILATGGFGPIVQLDLAAQAPRCRPDHTIVNSSILNVLIEIGDERLFLAGETRADPLSMLAPRSEPQRVTIARAVPR